jgi:hypothetical protein
MSGWASLAAALWLCAAGGAAAARDPGDANDLSAAPAEKPWAVAGDLGATLMSRFSAASTSLELARAQAIGVSIDRRVDRLHLFARLEANAWRDRRDDGTYDLVLTFNLGAGARLDYAGGRLRSSLAIGATLLAVPSDVDQAGTFGVFTDIRPVAYAWPLGAGARLGVVPLSLTLALPVLTGIPLVSIQYRTTVFAERDF